MHDPRPRVIYGVFRGRICFYVGQTVNPRARYVLHRRKYPRAAFKQLAKVKSVDANAEESKWIKHFKAIGQAADNKQITAHRPTFFVYGSTEIVCLDTGETFDSLQCAAHVLDMSVSTMNQRLNQTGVMVVRKWRYMKMSEAYNAGWNLRDHGCTHGNAIFTLHWNPLHRIQFELGWSEAERRKVAAR